MVRLVSFAQKLKKATALPTLGVCRMVRLVSFAQKLKSATSRGPSGHELGRNRSGNLWNSRSTCRKTGFSAMVRYRNSSEPSGADGPRKSPGISVALQQTPSLLHDSSMRSALTSYAGEKSDTPTNSIWFDLQYVLMRICLGWWKCSTQSLTFEPSLEA